MKITPIETDGWFCENLIEFSSDGVMLRVERETGNWYPDDKEWTASIQADVRHYANPDLWAYGYAAYGETPTEAIRAAAEYASRKGTIKMPDGLLDEFINAANREYNNLEIDE